MTSPTCSGWSDVELEDVAGLGAPEVVVELGDDGAVADLVELVLGGQQRLVVAGDLAVDRHVVAVAGRPVDR